MRKRVYYVHLKGMSEGSAIVASSPGKAKKCFLALGDYPKEFYTDLRTKVFKHLDDLAEKLPEGALLEDEMGWQWTLKNSIYEYYDGVDCPRCGAKCTTVAYSERIGFYCVECEDPEVLKEVVG
ncbi:MAG: hypothetical protein DRN40_04995 [Thermoplasmata archaeon]|nr:MAG: hypothetical protein DRN40_04995 [Thermoplasmata archaeon]